eukprot:gnl/TRDRNA2_/TRDRNA2_164974_c1_seq2.p1 gnl/TRDRNA2_/TRDRNA2_164974_c1~~gnl/TRDRNA2_/TRDRNA2_164974_c1_seq2.p1  ORF type:complete len:228 (+),score=23.84 gnl/TRDRNA2_/TRDRNA2_164974_c1_seq2:87-686(+)
MPVELYEICVMADPGADFWKWSGVAPPENEGQQAYPFGVELIYDKIQVQTFIEDPLGLDVAGAENFLGRYQEDRWNEFLEQPLELGTNGPLERWWEDEEPCRDLQYDREECRKVFPKCRVEYDQLVKTAPRDMGFDGDEVPRPWTVPRGLCRFRAPDPCARLEEVKKTLPRKILAGVVRHSSGTSEPRRALWRPRAAAP